MATFYLLPPRACLDAALADHLGRFLPGLPLPADLWDTIASHLGEAAGWPADLILVPRDDLPDGEEVTAALRDSFGADPDDRVIEVRNPPTGRAKNEVIGPGAVSGAGRAR